jgi:sirohydrochlorin ferrochelatase
MLRMLHNNVQNLKAGTPRTLLQKVAALKTDINLRDDLNSNLSNAHQVTASVLGTLGGEGSQGHKELMRYHFKEFVGLALGASELSAGLVKTLGRFAQIDDFSRRIKYLKSMRNAVKEKGIELDWTDYFKEWGQNAFNPESDKRMIDQNVSPLINDPLFIYHVTPDLTAIIAQLDATFKDIKITEKNRKAVFQKLEAIGRKFAQKAQKARQKELAVVVAEDKLKASTVIYDRMLEDRRLILGPEAGKRVKGRTAAQRDAANKRADAAKAFTVASGTLSAHNAASSAAEAATVAEEDVYLAFDMLTTAGLFVISSHLLDYARVSMAAGLSVYSQINRTVTQIEITQRQQIEQLAILKRAYLNPASKESTDG